MKSFLTFLPINRLATEERVLDRRHEGGRGGDTRGRRLPHGAPEGDAAPDEHHLSPPPRVSVSREWRV